MSAFESSFLVRAFTLINLFFGSYYKMTSSKLLSVILRLWCLFVTTLSVVRICLKPGENAVIFTITFLEALLTSLASQIHAQKYIFNFINTIQTCDKLMNYGNKYPFKKSMAYMAVILLTIFFRAFICIRVIMKFKHNEDSYLIVSCYFYAAICIDLNSFKATNIFCLLRNRLQMLRETLAKNRIPVNIVGNYEIKRNLKLVRKCVFNYYRLLDAFDSINMEMQLVLISILVFTVPRMTGNTFYHTMTVLRTNNLDPIIIINIIDLCLVFVLIFGPSLVAELCVSEVNSIKTLLTQQIIKCSDVALIGELQWALDCVCRRPFDFTLLRVIPVDIHLPGAVFTLCVTYNILAVQFVRFVVS